MGRQFVRLAAASVACVFAAGWLAAEAAADPVDLFSVPSAAQLSGRDAATAEPSDARSAFVTLNQEALGRRPAATKELRIKLFPGVSKTFRRDRLGATPDGGDVWIGSGEGADQATLVFDKQGKLTGQVQIGAKIYGVDPVNGQLHRASEVEPDRLPGFGPIMQAAQSKADERKAAEVGKAAPAPGLYDEKTVTVLFAYSERAAKKSPNIVSELDLAVAMANEAFKHAGVTLRRVGMTEISGFDETKSTWEDTLNAATKADGPFAGLNKLRNAKKADLVVVVRQPVSGDPYCGLAWYVHNPNHFTSKLGYSVIARAGCIRIHVLPHELGHNFGLKHDRYVHEPQPPTDYNFGFVNLNKRVADIMSYPDHCRAEGFECLRWNGFSDPTELVKHRKFGVPAGNPKAADAVRRLLETKQCIADYR